MSARLVRTASVLSAGWLAPTRLSAVAYPRTEGSRSGLACVTAVRSEQGVMARSAASAIRSSTLDKKAFSTSLGGAVGSAVGWAGVAVGTGVGVGGGAGAAQATSPSVTSATRVFNRPDLDVVVALGEREAVLGSQDVGHGRGATAAARFEQLRAD